MPVETVYLLNCNGTADQGMYRGNLYGFTMADANEKLIRNFIPCYRKADGVIGAYDTVTRQFFENAGTGAFAKGADVTL